MHNKVTFLDPFFQLLSIQCNQRNAKNVNRRKTRDRFSLFLPSLIFGLSANFIALFGQNVSFIILELDYVARFLFRSTAKLRKT